MFKQLFLSLALFAVLAVAKENTDEKLRHRVYNVATLKHEARRHRTLSADQLNTDRYLSETEEEMMRALGSKSSSFSSKGKSGMGKGKSGSSSSKGKSGMGGSSSSKGKSGKGGSSSSKGKSGMGGSGKGKGGKGGKGKRRN